MLIRAVKHSSFIFIAVILCGCAAPRAEKLYAPKGMLVHVTPDMHTAGYWISRHKSPDKIILDEEGIKQLNAYTRDELKLIKDLSAWPKAVSGFKLADELRKGFEGFKTSGYTLSNGKLPPEKFWNDIESNLNIENIPEAVPRQYGFISAYAGQRLLPAAAGLFAKPFDIDFDELQNSALDIGTPVVILHKSADGQWVYVESELSAGWVFYQTVGPVSEQEFKRVAAMPAGVAIAAKADVYFDNALSKHLGALRMGARLPLISDNGQTAVVLVPALNADSDAVMITGFIPSGQFHAGSLPLTARTVITQAFKLLHHPYGWGGMYGAQDCSRFIQEIFATTGVTFPRNSSAQIQVGERIAQWEKDADDVKRKFLVSETQGGETILGMRGHILLYLGEVDGAPYAIHAVWAYRSPGKKGDDIYVLNRVVVSDLDLGEGSKKGSLLHRLNAVQKIGLPDGG